MTARIIQQNLPPTYLPPTYSVRVSDEELMPVSRYVRKTPVRKIETFGEIHEKRRERAREQFSLWTEEQDAELIRMLKNGKRQKQIAKELGCTLYAVKSRLKRLRREGKL